MSKSLEALERIGNYPIDLGIDNSYEPPKSCGNVSIGLCFQKEFDLIKQDLERLEELEKENQELKDENYKLKRELNNIDYDFDKLEDEIIKLKKAIEILKRDFQFKIEDNFLWIYDDYFGALESLSLTEEEINLLKEVLE